MCPNASPLGLPFYSRYCYGTQLYTLVTWKHLALMYFSIFIPGLPSYHLMRYLCENFQSFWNRHKRGSTRDLTTQGTHLDHGDQSQRMNASSLCPLGWTILGCIIHGFLEVPNSTEPLLPIVVVSSMRHLRLTLPPCSALPSLHSYSLENLPR